MERQEFFEDFPSRFRILLFLGVFVLLLLGTSWVAIIGFSHGVEKCYQENYPSVLESPLKDFVDDFDSLVTIYGIIYAALYAAPIFLVMLILGCCAGCYVRNLVVNNFHEHQQ